MSSKLVRWGVLGAANIFRKNWEGIRRSGNGTLVAVASRDRSRAAQFIEDCQSRVPFSPAPKACTYEELLANPNIDAVYIPLPTGVRKEWVIKAAKAKKHVLCEKPCAPNSHDLAEMIAACRENGVQFMDGVMFMHSDRLPLLARVLSDGTSVGKIRRMTSAFSFRAGEEFVSQNIRAQRDLEPLGCLGDLGWYNVRFFLWAMQYRMPKRVMGRMLASQPAGDAKGVPMEFTGELFFDNDTTASFFSSFLAQNQQWVVLSGTEGFATVRDFVLPFFGGEAAFEVTQPQFEVDGCQFNMIPRHQRYAAFETSNNANNSQEVKMLRRFSEIVLSGKIDSHWPEIALKTQQVLDALVESAGNDGKPVNLP